MKKITVFTYRDGTGAYHIERWWTEDNKVKIKSEHMDNGLEVKEKEIEIPEEGLIIEEFYRDEIERGVTIYRIERNSQLHTILFHCRYNSIFPSRGDCGVCGNPFPFIEERFCSEGCKEKYEMMIKMWQEVSKDG